MVEDINAHNKAALMPMRQTLYDYEPARVPQVLID